MLSRVCVIQLATTMPLALSRGSSTSYQSTLNRYFKTRSQTRSTSLDSTKQKLQRPKSPIRTPLLCATTCNFRSTSCGESCALCDATKLRVFQKCARDTSRRVAPNVRRGTAARGTVARITLTRSGMPSVESGGRERPRSGNVGRRATRWLFFVAWARCRAICSDECWRKRRFV